MQLSHAHRPADANSPVRLTIGELLRATASRQPERITLVDGAPDKAARRRISYRELATLAESGARDLVSRYPAGSNIAVWAPNSLDWIMLEFSAALAGFPLVTINPSLTGHEATYILQQSRAVAIFVAKVCRANPLARRVEEIRKDLSALRYVSLLKSWADALGKPANEHVALPDVAPEATAMIQYTSGDCRSGGIRN